MPKFCLAFLFLLVLFGCNRKERKENTTSPTGGTSKLDPQAFQSKLAAMPDAILIDVRKPEELAEGYIEGAVNIDYTDSSFADKIHDLDKAKTYFVYCKSGKRTAGAVEQMEASGFENIYILDGGYVNWVEQGLETAKP